MAPRPVPASAPAPAVTADSIDEILEGITSRPRDSAPITPRVTSATSGESAAAYQSRARTPSPETTTPGPRPAVILSPSVETLLDDKGPSSLPRPMVRDTTPRSVRVASSPRLGSQPDARSLRDGAARDDVDTVLTPSARFKRFLRRAVLSSVVLSVVLITMASWKNNRHAARESAGTAAGSPATMAVGSPEPRAEAPEPMAAPPSPTPSPAPEAPRAAEAITTAGAITTAATLTAGSAGSTSASSPSAHAAASSAKTTKSAPAPAASPKNAAASAAPSNTAPPPAPGYEEFKKSFTP